MLKIEAPVKEYTGISAGIGFAMGVALVEEKDLRKTQKEYFKKKGYKIAKYNSKTAVTTKSSEKTDKVDKTNTLEDLDDSTDLR